MWILFLIAFALTAFVAILVAIGNVGRFLEVKRFHGATVTPVGSVVKGMQATVRGTVVEARREPPYPRITAGDVVFSRLEVVEQVGKQQHVALRSKNAQLFALADDKGNQIDVDPEMAELADAHETSLKATKAAPNVQAYISKAGSYHHQRTPATCVEEAITVGDVVTLRGQVILPLPGQMQAGDSELRINANRISLYVENPWKGKSGRMLMWSLLVTVVTVPAALGCLAWGGVL